VVTGLQALRQHWPWAAVAGGVVTTCVGTDPDIATARAFMGVVVGIAGMFATTGLPRARNCVAGAFLVGSFGLAFGSGSFSDPPSTLWGEILDSDAVRIRHELAIPRADRRWRAATAAGASPYLYVCARGYLEEPDTLDVFMDGVSLASLNPSMMFGPRPQSESVGFYRIPVPWGRLDGRERLSVEVARHAGTSRPLEVCGTFMGKPTLRFDASQLYDGTTWTSPWETRKGRYQIELRLENADGHVFGAWY
jgi:hypothetical protein